MYLKDTNLCTNWYLCQNTNNLIGENAYNWFRPGDTRSRYISMNWMISNWFQYWLVACLVPGQYFNILRPRQKGWHFPDIFKWIFLNENIWISLNISLKFVPKDPINNITVLVQITTWCWPGDKPLSEPMMVSLLTHICFAQPHWVKHQAGKLALVRSPMRVKIWPGEWKTGLRAGQVEYCIGYIRHYPVRASAKNF